ncbi:MAG: hypothetical protein K2X29_00885 [Candidatus Obscuribacterales bacterium]|nr:hypothetical protein [Candidatus Obscuribacterales bacterium]
MNTFVCTLISNLLILLTLSTCISAYAVDSPTDLLIVPGQSLGKIQLGMTHDAVTKLLGKPTHEETSVMEYHSAKRTLNIYLNKGRVFEIEFDSNRFHTQDGISLANYTQDRWRKMFKYSRMGTDKFCRAQLKAGGLTFYIVKPNPANCPNPSEPCRYDSGFVHSGPEPANATVRTDDWQPWDSNIDSMKVASPMTSAATLSTLKQIDDPSEFLEAPQVHRLLSSMMGKHSESFLDCAQIPQSWQTQGDERFVSAILRGMATLRECCMYVNLSSGHCIAGYLHDDDLHIFGASSKVDFPPAVVSWANDLKTRRNEISSSLPIRWHFHNDVAIVNRVVAPINLTGNYKRLGDDRWSGSSLKLQSVAGNKAKFQIDAYSGSHTGNASGTVPIINNVATYLQPDIGSVNPVDATLTLKFNSDKTISIQAGYYFCGMGVTLDGTYKKVDNLVPKFDSF